MRSKKCFDSYFIVFYVVYSFLHTLEIANMSNEGKSNNTCFKMNYLEQKKLERIQNE